jgi:hypothetical protein
MHTNILDTFGTADSVEWRHRRHTIRANTHPTGAGDRFMVWNSADQLVAEAPSLRSARRWIDRGAGSS